MKNVFLVFSAFMLFGLGTDLALAQQSNSSALAGIATLVPTVDNGTTSKVRRRVRANRPRVTGFVLWDTVNDRAVRNLRRGDVINVSALPEFTIVATTAPSEVGFSYQENQTYRIENFNPYVISADRSATPGQIRRKKRKFDEKPNFWQEYQFGKNVLRAVPYSNEKGLGIRGKGAKIVFTLVDTPGRSLVLNKKL
jgi:hypothetical protein